MLSLFLLDCELSIDRKDIRLIEHLVGFTKKEKLWDKPYIILNTDYRTEAYFYKENLDY